MNGRVARTQRLDRRLPGETKQLAKSRHKVGLAAVTRQFCGLGNREPLGRDGVCRSAHAAFAQVVIKDDNYSSEPVATEGILLLLPLLLGLTNILVSL